MKKLFILIVLFLSSCQLKNTTDTIFVASVSIDKVDNTYNGYFYIPSSVEVGSESSNSDAKGKIGETHASKIVDLFYEISFSASQKINFAHISTLILHESVLNNNDINELLQFIKNSNRFDYNFYILATSVSSKEMYSLTSVNNEKLITTMIIEPQNALDVFVSTKPVHYLNFCRDYYDGKVVKLPLIEVKEEWKLDEEAKSYMSKGITFVSDKKTNSYKSNELDFRFLNSTKGLYITSENITFTVLNYSIKIKYKKEIEIIVKGKVENYDKSIDLDPNLIVKSKIKTIINTICDDCDFLNIEFYNRVYQKEYKTENIVYKVEIK